VTAPFRLALYELRRFRGPLRRAGLVVLLVVPSLYAGVYLWSSWNPYGHLDRIPVAVVNQDRPVQTRGMTVHAGQDFVDQLKADREFDWHFVDAGQAIHGLRNAKYFFVITVPPDFSAKLASVSGGTPQRAAMRITLDDANGYIIGIIAASAQSKIQAQVNTAAQSAYLEATLGSLSDIKRRLRQAADGAARLRDGAKSAHSGARRLSSGLKTLQSGGQQVAAGTQELAGAAGAIDASLKRLDARLPRPDAVRTALDALATAHPDLRSDARFRALQRQVDQLGGSLDAQASDVRATVRDAVTRIDELNAGAKKVAAGIGTAHGGAADLSGGLARLQTGAATLARRLRQAAAQVPSPDAGERARDADVLANPVQVQSANLHPAHVYGRGVAPFFLSIGLWVFGLVAFLLLRPIAGEALASRLPSITVALGGWLPAAFIGTLAATIMFGVLEVGIGLDADRPVLLLALLWLAALAFIALLHLLRAALDAVGSVVILVLLVLQLGGSGGLYPLQVAPGFFDVLHPVLPMTYTIDAFRYAISGGESSHLVVDLSVLAGLLIAAIALTTLSVHRRRAWTIARLKPELEL
jgi:putative membrane protein